MTSRTRLRRPAMTTDASSPARREALALLARHACGADELAGRLTRKGYPRHAIGEAVAWLLSLGYLDDEAYARDLAQSYAAKGYGVYRIRGELKARLLPAELVDQILEELPPAAEILDDLIARLTAGRDFHDPRQHRRLVNALNRRGYAWEDIQAGLGRVGMIPDCE